MPQIRKLNYYSLLKGDQCETTKTSLGKKCFFGMVWIVEKKIFYHILDMGFESVGIPVRVKFEFDVQDGKFVSDSLSVESLYNQQAVVKRYPAVRMASLDKEIHRTVRKEIRKYMQSLGYIPKKNNG